jgi:hypothetical protein
VGKPSFNVGLGTGVMLGAGEPEAAGDSDADGEPETDGESEGLGAAEGVGDGDGVVAEVGAEVGSTSVGPGVSRDWHTYGAALTELKKTTPMTATPRTANPTSSSAR